MATTSVYAKHDIGGTSLTDEERRSYARHVNPIWVKLLDALGLPPLTVSETQLNYCVESIRSVVETVQASSVFWIDALHLGRRAISL
jgi:hypothetical protein